MSFGYQVLGFGTSANTGGPTVEYIGGYSAGDTGAGSAVQTPAATKAGDICIFFGGNVNAPSGNFAQGMSGGVQLIGPAWVSIYKVHLYGGIRRVLSDGEAYPTHTGVTSSAYGIVHLRPSDPDISILGTDIPGGGSGGGVNAVTPTVTMNAANDSTANVKAYIVFGTSLTWDQGGTRAVSQTMDKGGTFDGAGTARNFGVVCYEKADALNVEFSGGYSTQRTQNQQGYSPAFGYLIKLG